MAKYTRGKYDDCRICDEHAQNKKVTDHTLTPVINRKHGCIEPGGMSAGSLTSSSIVPNKSRRVLLEGVLRGQYTDANCPEYNRDRVNTSILPFEKELIPPPVCQPDMEPIHTRQGCPQEYKYDRLITLGHVPPHPWEKSIDYGVNTRELSRKVYKKLNPFSDCTCGNVDKE